MLIIFSLLGMVNYGFSSTMIILRQNTYSGIGTKAIYGIEKAANKLRKAPISDIAVKRKTITAKNAAKTAASDINTVALAIAPGRVATVPLYTKLGVTEKIRKVPVLGTANKVASKPFEYVAGKVFSESQKEFGHVDKHFLKVIAAKDAQLVDKIGNTEISKNLRRAVHSKKPKNVNYISERIKQSQITDIPIKSKKEYLKEGIQTVNEASTNTKKVAKYLKDNSTGTIISDIPQEILDKGIIASTGTVAGYAAIPVVGYIPGTTAASVAAEAAVRKAYPKYSEASNKLAKKYRDSKLKKGIKDTIDAPATFVKKHKKHNK